MSWRLKKTRQCAKCPWRKDVNPCEIPNGYSDAKHRDLQGTIAKPGDLRHLNGSLPAMACHETHDAHCLGWLSHQLGPGNNIALRIHTMSCDNIGRVRLVGEQHQTFEDTLPGEILDDDSI
jgi:hypothetical protein